MKNSIKIIIIMGFFAACQKPASQSRQKIVGGSIVQSESDITMRSTVSLLSSSGGLCTGTLIGPNHVITAAHCLTNTQGLTIGYGPDLNKAVPGIKVVKSRYHPRWSKGPYDVGIVVFEGTLPANLSPVAIAPLTGINNGVPVILAGYGVTGQERDDAGTLRRVDAQVKNFIPGDKEFEMQEGLGKGSCFGDSGGPAYIENSGVLSVIGITSRGENCDTGDGVYGDARLFQGWFKCTAKEFGYRHPSLLNDASNVDCKAGTEDTEVSSSQNVSVVSNDVKAFIGEAGSSPDSYKIYLSAKADANNTNNMSYCSGSKSECALSSATWIQGVKTSTVGDRAIFSIQTLTLTNDLKVTVKSEAAGSSQLQELVFKKSGI